MISSPAEEKRLAEYEKAVADQIRQEKEYAERPFRKTTLSPLLNALISEAKDDINASGL